MIVVYICAIRLRDVPFKVMQRTLRYMTKLDRAIENDHDLAHLSGLFRSINVTSKDLFDLFKRVSVSSQSSRFTNHKLIDCFVTDCTDLQ